MVMEDSLTSPTRTHGEIFEVDQDTLDFLDVVEGAWYSRKNHFTTAGDEVQVYVWAGKIPPDAKEIPDGFWRKW